MSPLLPVDLPATATGWPSPSASRCGAQHQRAVARDSDERAEMENQQLEIDHLQLEEPSKAELHSLTAQLHQHSISSPSHISALHAAGCVRHARHGMANTRMRHWPCVRPCGSGPAQAYAAPHLPAPLARRLHAAVVSHANGHGLFAQVPSHAGRPCRVTLAESRSAAARPGPGFSLPRRGAGAVWKPPTAGRS